MSYGYFSLILPSPPLCRHRPSYRFILHDDDDDNKTLIHSRRRNAGCPWSFADSLARLADISISLASFS